MVEDLTAQEVAVRLRATPPSVILLDVREPFEREIARIEPSLHIPMQQVPDHLGQLPRTATIVVYCHSGGRSAAVAGYLEEHGYERVANLRGGIDAWSREVDPTVDRYG
jgi:rhodanese-related sulfurtransferase